MGKLERFVRIFRIFALDHGNTQHRTRLEIDPNAASNLAETAAPF
jgi:hypothetical protein